MEEQILELARQGDEYIAIERTSIVIRKYRKENKLEKGMLFYMKLAKTFVEIGKFAAASNCAIKSIQLFPHQQKKILASLKKMYYDFIFNATPEYACVDYFSFIHLSINLFSDPDNEFKIKAFEIAKASNFYNYSQLYVLILLNNESSKLQFDPTKITYYLNQLLQVILDYILTLPEKDRSLTGQFVISRSILAVLSIPVHGCQFAIDYRNMIQNSIDKFGFNLLEQPMFHYACYYIKSVQEHSLITAKFLDEKYKSGLEKDPEIKNWASKIQENHMKNNNNSGQNSFSNIFQSLMGSMFQHS